MATIGFEEKLWQATDKLRGSTDVAEYKNVALGLMFLNIYQIHLRKSMKN